MPLHLHNVEQNKHKERQRLIKTIPTFDYRLFYADIYF